MSRIASVVCDACQSEVGFEINVKGTGVFPSARAPRVLWAGISEGSDRLVRLQAKFETDLVSLGFEAAERAFHPHLTLGRVRSAERAERLIAELQKDRDREFGRSPVTEVVLMRSELHRAGSIYTPLERVSLKR